MPQPPHGSLDVSENGCLSEKMDRVLAEVAEAKKVILAELASLSKTEPYPNANGDAVDAKQAFDMKVQEREDIEHVLVNPVDVNQSAVPRDPTESVALVIGAGVRPLTDSKRSLAVDDLGQAYGELMLTHGSSKCHLDLSAAIRSSVQGDHVYNETPRTHFLHARHAFGHIFRVRPVLAVDSVMGFVIIFNALVIGVSADSADWHGWFIFDVGFCCFFILELGIKMRFLGLSRYFCEDSKWHLFEVILLSLSIAEIVLYLVGTNYEMFNETSLFRVLRLARLAKLMRVCRLQIATDLVMMINGAIGGIRTLMWSILLISLPLYVVALILRETLGAEEKLSPSRSAENFSSLPKAFFTVYRCVVAGDCSERNGRPVFVLVSEEYGWMYGAIYALTLLFMTFGLFNVIGALFVENTLAAAKQNELKLKEGRLRNQEVLKAKSLELAMMIYAFKEGITVTMILEKAIDFETISSMEVTHREFQQICTISGFSDLLCELDIAPENQKDLFDTLDSDRGGSLDIHEIIEGIAKLRGDARKSDIVAVLLSVRNVTHLQRVTLKLLDSHTQTLQNLQLLNKSSTKATARK
jgi:hypothetical protein